MDKHGTSPSWEYDSAITTLGYQRGLRSRGKILKKVWAAPVGWGGAGKGDTQLEEGRDSGSLRREEHRKSSTLGAKGDTEKPKTAPEEDDLLKAPRKKRVQRRKGKNWEEYTCKVAHHKEGSTAAHRYL